MEPSKDREVVDCPSCRRQRWIDADCPHCGNSAITVLKHYLAILRRYKAKVEQQLAEAERWIRERVWAGHGCLGIYGDDGEMQCNNIARHGKPLDFKRMPMEEVFQVDTQCRLEAMAKFYKDKP